MRAIAEPEEPIRPATPALKALGARRAGCCCCALPLLAQSSPYLLILGIDVLIAVLFAASLHFIMGPGGMHSFGHAAYFGLGAYGAALLVKWLGAADGRSRSSLAPLVARARRAAVRLVLRAAVRRLSRHADARLRADRLVDRVPVGGTDRRLQRRDRRLAAAAVRQGRGLFPADAGAGGRSRVLLLRRLLFAPFGYAMRAGRDSPLRAEAIGIDVKRVHWLAFAVAGAVCGVAGGAVRLRQGLDLAGDHPHRPLDRRPGDGAARRHPDADRADRRRVGLRRAAGHGDARRPNTGARCSAASSCCWCWRSRRASSAPSRAVSQGRAAHERCSQVARAVARPSAACARSTTSASRSRAGEFLALIGPERRRQDRPAST